MKKKRLIIDDESATCLILAPYSAADFDVVPPASGPEALKCPTRGNRLDAIVAGHDMPLLYRPAFTKRMNAPRVRFLRSTSFDKLPQLYDVLRRDVSLVTGRKTSAKLNY